ncbi:MAG: fibronectin type III domain-containing protein, partial [Anaerobutyricum sp.]|nr:fibronectin type III domain-containing protein [Anaerobutyricum sp.]
MKSKKVLSFFLILCLVFPMVSALKYDKAEAAGTEDAFGIKMDDSTFNKEAEKKNNPYGTEEWFPLSTISELYVARGNNSTRYFNTYDYNGTNMGDTGSIGNVFGTKSNPVSSVGKNEGNKDGFHFMDTAGCDIYGEGQKRFAVSVGYRIDTKVMELFLTDVCGNRIGNTVTLGSKQTLEYLEEADAYENTGFISVAAGDFDGNGKDSVVVYVPEMESGKDHPDQVPAIYMYDIDGTTLKNRRIIREVYDLLKCDNLTNARTSNGRVFRNAPVVQLVAADTDKDNVDELVITAGLNNTYDEVNEKQSRMFIMDYNKSGSWNESCSLDTSEYDTEKRLRWASSSVGDLSIQNSVVDYPEVITAGWIDNSHDKDTHMTHDVGSYMTTCKKVEKNKEGTSIGIYNKTKIPSIKTSGFTKGGHFKDDNVQCLLPVAAFLADGIGKQASVLISDTVYTVKENGELNEVYKDGYFKDDDDGIGDSIIQNGLVQDVVAGNFDGNEEGREQVIFTTCQKRQSFSQYFNKIYTYQKDENGNWSKEDTGYFFNKKNYVFVSLCALDTDNDSTIVKLEDVDHSYTEPEVLAILESTPYFGEIEGGDVGNSQTTYGTTEGVGNSTGTAHGLSTEIIAGYELDIAGNGAEFELSIENNFTWETVEKETVDFTLEWANDTGDNVVIVYRRPVTSWKYKVKNTDSDIILARQGDLLTSMITVDAYNDAAEEYDDLSEIPDSALAEPGNPFSYRNNLGGLDDGVLTGKWSSYNGSGTPTQAIEYEKEQEKTFTYELNTSFTACAKVFGVKAGGGAGYAYSDSTSTINTSSITKSGTVSMVSEDGYDFSWMFAHWTMNLNDSRVPVLGYVLKDVYAPPSSPEGLSVSEVAQTTATITWDQGKRSADEYRIYQVYEDGSKVQIGVVDGTENSYRLTRLKPNTAYTYVLTAYTDSGACKGESVPSEEVKVATLPDGVESVEMVHPQAASAKEGGSASFAADISVISEDYQATTYQWQKRVKGESWEDISGATSKKLTVSDLGMEDNKTEYRCIFKVSYSSATALVRYYSNPATLTVGKIPVKADLTISGHDGKGSGTLIAPYKGKSDYQVAGEPDTQTTTKEVNVEIPASETTPKLTVYEYKDTNNETSYYGIETTDSGDAVYYTVSKSTVDGKETYAIGSKIQEVNSTIYKNIENNETVPLPDFNINEPIVKKVPTENESITETYYLRGMVNGDTKTPPNEGGKDTRLASVEDYTFYWYKSGNEGEYYSFKGLDQDVGEKITEEESGKINADSLFDVYSIDQQTIEETKTDTETVILGREETWMIEDQESTTDPKAYEKTTGYLITRLITTTSEGQDPSSSIGVTVMEMSEVTSYKDSKGNVIDDFNPSAWTIVTETKPVVIDIPTYNSVSGDKLTLRATVTEEEGGSAVKGAKVDFQIINTKTNAQITKSGTTNTNGVVSTEWTADANGLY